MGYRIKPQQVIVAIGVGNSRYELHGSKRLEKKQSNQGHVIFKKGDAAEGLFIVAEGEVGLFFPNNETNNTPDIILNKTEIFGEMGVIDDQLRMATARAMSDVVVVYFSRKDFETKLDETDVIVRGVLAVLSDRLRQIQKP